VASYFPVKSLSLDTEMSAFSFKVKPPKLKLKKLIGSFAPFFHPKWNYPRIETTFVLISSYVQGTKAPFKKPKPINMYFFPTPFQSLSINLFAKGICSVLTKCFDVKAGSRVLVVSLLDHLPQHPRLQQGEFGALFLLFRALTMNSLKARLTTACPSISAHLGSTFKLETVSEPNFSADALCMFTEKIRVLLNKM